MRYGHTLTFSSASLSSLSQAADENDCKCEEKSEKWRKRDKNKHLAGERSRRQKRMTRLYELRDLLIPFEEKATVNNILQQAAKQIREVSYPRSPQSPPRGQILVARP
jgi:hypothetical protein